MYGSSFMFATLRPRFSIRAPIVAETMPLPSDETTPPVTNTNLVCCAMNPFVAPRAGVRQRVSTRSPRRNTSAPGGAKIPADSLLLLLLARQKLTELHALLHRRCDLHGTGQIRHGGVGRVRAGRSL